MARKSPPGRCRIVSDWASEGSVVSGIQREVLSCERRQPAALRAEVVADQWEGREEGGIEEEMW